MSSMNFSSQELLVDGEELPHSMELSEQLPSESGGTDMAVPKTSPIKDRTNVGIPFHETNHKKSLVAFYVEDEEESFQELTDKEKAKCNLKIDRREARHSASIFLSELYAMILILIGVVFSITEALLDQWQMSGVVTAFLMYLTVVSSALIIYILLENERNKRAVQKRPKIRDRTSRHVRVEQNPEQMETKTTGELVTHKDGDIFLSPSQEIFRVRSLSSSSGFSDDYSGRQRTESLSNDTAVDEDVVNYIRLNTQMASQAHEGTSFYLRFGCLLFAIAYILFIALEIEYFYSGDRCHFTEKYPWVLFFHLTFVLVQTFFLFKHNKLLTEKRKILTRFGLMHIIATNFVVWIRALVSEIKNGVTEDHGSGLHLEDLSVNDSTGNSSDCLESIIVQISHYLFPFILEYSLIAVATFLSMFMSLDIRISGDVFHSIRRYLQRTERDKEKLRRSTSVDSEPEETKMLDKAHTGLFIGVIVLTGTVIAFILVQYNLVNATDDNDNGEKAEIIYHSTDICLHILAVGVLILAFYKLLNLRHSMLRNNIIDNLLLVISMCGLVLYELFKTVCVLYTVCNEYSNVQLILHGVCTLLIPIQALLQTPFIISSMKRYSDQKDDRINKPGRGVITFLLILNISIWLFKSFTEAFMSVELMESFYGVVPWQVILHVNLPLMLFYRFHSSVCLADIWVIIYENEESPIEYMDL